MKVNEMITIKELNEYCRDHNKSILVCRGKLKGFNSFSYPVKQFYTHSEPISTVLNIVYMGGENE